MIISKRFVSSSRPRQVSCLISTASRAARFLCISPSRCSTLAQPRQLFSSSKSREVDFTHTVIGGGVVGLSIARSLATQHPDASVLLLEQHSALGTETTSRNSEVIHAGIYYPRDSLKTRLCIAGKHRLYEYLDSKQIPYRRTGKWILAQDDRQFNELERVNAHANSLDVPTRFLSQDEIARREPDVRAEAGVLESSSTGIVDSHALMTSLEGDLVDAGGTVSVGSHVTAISKSNASGGPYIVTIQANGQHNESSTITTETLINAAGLYALPLSNMLLPASHPYHREPSYAKGTYYTYVPPVSSARITASTLLYPAPQPGHAGLGTHLTLDLAGRIRFGPDVEWVDSPTDYTLPDPQKSEAARKKIEDAVTAIKAYLPNVDARGVQPDYAGIRPKLGKGAASQGKGFEDFYIQEECDAGLNGFVNLLGIESPGLTSALAIGEMVEEMLYGRSKS